MNKILAMLFLALFVVLISCSKQKDVSDEFPFNLYLGENFILNEDVDLVERDKNNYRFSRFTIGYDNELLTEGSSYYKRIPSGTRLSIKQVKMYKFTGYKTFYSIGYLFLMDGSKIDFEVQIGGCYDNSHELGLSGLPWDMESNLQGEVIRWDDC
jgi:hypothetical protein